MQIEEVMKSGLADFSGIPESYYLLGLLSGKRGKVMIERVAVFHGGEDVGARKLIPGSGDDDRIGVVLAHERQSGIELVLRKILRTA